MLTERLLKPFKKAKPAQELNGHAKPCEHLRQTPGEVRLEKALREQSEVHLRMAERINFLEEMAEKVTHAARNVDNAMDDVFNG